MLILLAFAINILLNPLICKVKQFFVKKTTWTDKLYTTESALIKVNSEALICEETFLYKSISKYVRLRYWILRYIFIASPLHSCQPWSNITTLFPISVFFFGSLQFGFSIHFMFIFKVLLSHNRRLHFNIFFRIWLYYW